MVSDPKELIKSDIADVKQTGEAFGNSAKFLRWQDREANKKFFAGEFETFTNEGDTK